MHWTVILDYGRCLALIASIRIPPTDTGGKSYQSGTGGETFAVRMVSLWKVIWLVDFPRN